MSNWDYAERMPVDAGAPQRGSMTLARRLSLVAVDGRPRLRQTPVGPPGAETARLEDVAMQPSEEISTPVPAPGRLEIAIDLGRARGAALRIEGEGGRAVSLAYDPAAGELLCDRRECADGRPEGFASVERMPVSASPVLALDIWLDGDSIEIYADGGTRVLTDLVAPLRSPRLRVSGVGGAIRIIRLLAEEALVAEGAAR